MDPDRSGTYLEPENCLPTATAEDVVVVTGGAAYAGITDLRTYRHYGKLSSLQTGLITAVNQGLEELPADACAKKTTS